ncbi:MAG: cell wall hydrolase [Alphaproteobacteria bacterium]|nr:cell wall hydrolase [Alphaproteobacteria bacterium]
MLRAAHVEMEVDILARTLWGEARGEGKAGMEAVAMVILNRAEIARAAGGYWWGNSVIEVCRKPYQFSCWNKSDPNMPKLLSVGLDNPYFSTAVRVARRALLGFLSDPTKGATHYHARSVQPYWAKGQKPVAVIGRHIFYRLAGE